MVAKPGSAGQRALDHRQVQGRRAGARRDMSLFQEAKTRLKSSWELSSRAGAVRLFQYELRTEKVTKAGVPVYVAKSFVVAP